MAVIAAPNDQRGPILSDAQGQFRFERLPAGEVTLIASGPGCAAARCRWSWQKAKPPACKSS
ncbi:MAG: carboxypeptidase-like regulatory domain-containing protein [Chloroflexi bacterium]|nr:carboxypeptidase-like regulatory domain-containing protein [Chloroflexota bacterium]